MSQFALVSTEVGDAGTASLSGNVTDAEHLLSEQPSVRAYGTDDFVRVNLDFAAAVTVDVVALLRTTLAAGATWSIGTKVSLLAPPVTVAAEEAFAAAADPRGWRDGRRILAPAVTSRFWRITIRGSGGTAMDPVSLGRLVMGRAWRPAVTIDRDVQLEWVDETALTRVPGGPTWADPRLAWQRLQCSLSWLDTSEAAALAAIMKRHGTSTPLWAVRALDSPNWRDGAVYGRLAAPLRLPTEPFRGVWRARMRIEEML